MVLRTCAPCASTLRTGVVTVVDVDDEKRVNNSLVQIWKVNFGYKVSFCSDFEDKFSRFGQDFKVDVQARF